MDGIPLDELKSFSYLLGLGFEGGFIYFSSHSVIGLVVMVVSAIDTR